VKKSNPLDKEATPLYYAQPVWSSEVGIKEIAEQISKYCTVTKTDVYAVLISFVEMLPSWLKEGHSVRLDNFGIIKLSFRSNGKEEEADVTADCIKSLRILLRASTEFKKAVSDLHYEKISSAESTENSGSTGE